MAYTRFAIYYLPPEGVFSEFGAAWLGWDVLSGVEATHAGLTGVAGLEEVTRTPRKYGFHATLKPPFKLVDGCTAEDLDAAMSSMAGRCAPAQADGLELSVLGRFLALTLEGDPSGVERVAAACVRDLDAFRAPATEAELARRRKSGLTERQDALLQRWGYPYVMEEFRFHMTLTGRLSDEELPHWRATVLANLPRLQRPFRLNEVSLLGERPDGRFELIHRYALTG
jgi:putative phosphonate metabolism protein